MATRTLVDTDSVQIIENKWLNDVRQFQTNVDTLFKHGTINAALSNIGIGTQTTIVVTENTAVNANTDLTSYPNITWLFLGAGKLTPATGVTLTLYSPNTIMAPHTQTILDATSGTIAFANPGTVYAGWFGARSNVQSVSFVQKAHDSLPSTGGEVVMTGNYLFNDTLDWSKDKSTLRGQGISTTKITCTTVGVPAISVNTEAVFVTFRDFYLLGNDLTGGSGCGHGIALTDPTPDTGAFSPQQCLIENVRIEGFRGSDSDGRSGSMEACGVFQVSTLENVIRRCYIDSCGFGIFGDSLYTPRIHDNIVLDCDKYGIALVGESSPIESGYCTGNDIINNGDGGTYSMTGWTAPTGNIFCYNVAGLDLSGNKVKNGSTGGILLHFCKGVNVTGNWIRSDDLYGMYVRNCNGVNIHGNHFDQSSGSASPGRYLTIEMESGNNSNGLSVCGNHFRWQGGINLDYAIKIVGDAAARRLQGFRIDGNYFGDISTSSATTITACITVVQASLVSGSINFNSFQTQTNATITSCFTTDANCSFTDFRFDHNAFHQAGGTLTAQKTIAALTFPQVFYGSGSPEGAVTAFIGSQYYRTNGGAGTSLYVKESGTGNTGWAAK